MRIRRIVFQPPYLPVAVVAPPDNYDAMTTDEVALWIADTCLSGVIPQWWKLVDKAISLHQPWAYSITDLGKDLENRKRRMAKPGWYFLHAGRHFDEGEYLTNALWILEKVKKAVPPPARIDFGGIVGIMRLDAWVENSPSAWFMGPKAATIGKALRLDFIPCRGMQGVFYPTTP